MTLGNVVTALAGVVTFGGYVLVVGAIVSWLDVRAIGVPTIGVVADMPRNELFGRGLETLAVWLLLALILAVVIVSIGSTIRKDPRLPLAALVVSTVIGVGFAGIWQIDSVALSVAGTVVLAAAVIALAVGYAGNLRTHRELFPIGIACVAGVVLGVGLELLLINPGRIPGFIAAFVALVLAAWSAAEMFWRRKIARGGSIGPDPLTGPEARRASRLRDSRRRSITAVVLLAIVLASGAIASRQSRDFWAARVTMTNGTCASGTLLVRNSNEVLLAAPKRKSAGHQIGSGFVEIPEGMISNVQVIGPPGAVRQVKAESCAKAVGSTPKGAFAPYPLVGENSTPEVDPPVSAVQGPEGKEGKRGPEGERGAEGKRGPEGERGAEGKRGPDGKRGPEGERGAEGKRGPDGKRGPTGRSGATGKTGARGERGPRGPRGFSGVDGN